MELLGVEKVYRDFWGRARVRALEPLSLEIQPGEILALLGPNGAGKSTTIKLILGLLFPTQGRVRVFGDSPRKPKSRARVGYLPEETRLHRFLDARETLELFGRLHGLARLERRQRTEQLIEMVGLRGNERRPVGEFSKGMARRIGLAVALAGDPDLLILDEPTSGLDPLGTREIKDLLVELRGRGRTVLLSSHLLDDVEDVADRIAILYGGKLQRLGRAGELLARHERVRLELDRPGDLSPAEVAAKLRAALPGEASIDVSVPSDRLESLFRRVVLEAEAAESGTSGARSGGPVAAFLGGEQPLSVAAAPVDVDEPAESPAPVGPRVESLREAAPAAATVEPPDSGALAQLIAPREETEQVLERLQPPPASEAEPTPVPMPAAPEARSVLSRLVPGAQVDEPAPVPVEPVPLEAPPPAAAPLSSRGQGVLERLLGGE